MLIFSLLVVGTFWHIVVTVWVSVYAVSPVFFYVLLWSLCAPCFPCILCFLLVLIFLLWHLFHFPFVSLSHLVSVISSSQEVSLSSVYIKPQCLFTPVLCVSSCVPMCFWFVFKPALWVLHLHPFLFPASHPKMAIIFGSFWKYFPLYPLSSWPSLLWTLHM